jgi:hypothetical protein
MALWTTRYVLVHQLVFQEKDNDFMIILVFNIIIIHWGMKFYHPHYMLII